MNGLSMFLYHGRKDPNQTMDDWGSVGPTIHNIVSFGMLAESNELFLFVNNREALLNAATMTSWTGNIGKSLQVLADKSFHEQSSFSLSVPLTAERNEFIICFRNNDLVYYGDFIIQHHKGRALTLNLANVRSRSRAYSVILPNIDFLKFTYGIWQIWFKTHQDCETARQLTDWDYGIDYDRSLILPYQKDRLIMAGDHQYSTMNLW